eukprot:8014997-Alexandrium_andersonii.AAC.1
MRNGRIRTNPRAVVDEAATTELRERRQRSGIRAMEGAEIAQKTPQLLELGVVPEGRSGSAAALLQVPRGRIGALGFL